MAGILKKNETKRSTDFYRSPGGYQSIKWCAILQASWWTDCNVSGRSVQDIKNQGGNKELVFYNALILLNILILFYSQ